QEGLWVRLKKPNEYLPDDASTDRPEVETVLNHLGFLQDVVPEGRRALETEAICSEFFKVGRGQRGHTHRSSNCLAGRQLPGQMPQKVALRQSQRTAGKGQCVERQMEEGRGDPGVDPLIRFALSIAEVEEGLPSDETPRRPRTAAQIDGVCLTIASWIEDHGEERITVVAGQVGAVAGAYHAVPEAIGGSLELYRNE